MNDRVIENFTEMVNDRYEKISVINLDEVVKAANKKYDELPHDNIDDKIRANRVWLTQVEGSLGGFIRRERGDRYIILVGMPHHRHDNNLYIKLSTNKFIYDDDRAVESLIDYHLDKYRLDIIDGTMQLKYIDHDFLSERLKNLVDGFVKNGYVKKTPKAFYKWLDMKILGRIDSDDYVDDPYCYYASLKDTDVDHNIHAYKYRWLALVSVCDSDNKIKRGMAEYRDILYPYIQELSDDAFDSLDTACYLYVISKDNMDERKYKYISQNDSIEVTEKIYIMSVKDELSRLNVKMIKKDET